MGCSAALVAQAIVDKQIVIAIGPLMTGDTCRLVIALGYATCQPKAFGIFVQGAIGQILGPEPVLVLWIITGFALKHYGDCGQVLIRIIGDRLNLNPFRSVVALDNHQACVAVDSHCGVKSLKDETVGLRAFIRPDVNGVRACQLGGDQGLPYGFGVPAVVAINHFVTDTQAEIDAVKAYVADQGSQAITCRHWEKGSAGTENLARRVVEIADSGQAQYAPLYPDDLPLFKKIETIAKRIYRADAVVADKKIRDQLRAWEGQDYGTLPICMAKTQYSFSTDPALRGAPVGHSVPVREVRLCAGAGFVVVICGAIMTMPGLPRVPAAEAIKLNDQGEIAGLF